MNVKPLKKEKHHWWPKTLSKYWKGEDGRVGAIKPDGSLYRSSHHTHGQIKNGHSILFGASRADASVWDHCFERVFDGADSAINPIVSALVGIVESTNFDSSSQRFIPCTIAPELHLKIVASMVSLCVRGPMNRNMAISLPEKIRGPIPEPERSRLIASNLNHSQPMWERAIRDRGKHVIAYSETREFIFGDGFYHNLTTQGDAHHSPEYLIPVTPHIALGYVSPSKWVTEPAFHIIRLTNAEVAAVNDAVQVYSKDALFFANEEPTLNEAFQRETHLEYESHRNPIRNFLYSIPGVG